MRLVAGHGSGGVVQHHQREVCLVVEGVHHARDATCEEGGVAHEGEARGVGLDAEDALRDVDARAHAQARVHHVERGGVSQRIAADVAAVDGLALAHGLLHGVEAGTMRAASAQHGRTDGQLGGGVGLSRGDLSGWLAAKEARDGLPHRLHRVLARGLDVARQLAADLGGEAKLAAHRDERALDDRVKLLDTEHLVEPLQELDSLALGERERRTHAQDARMVRLVQVLAYILVADAVRGDAHASGLPCPRQHEVVARVAERLGELGVAGLNLRVVDHREAREDDPAGGVLHEALGLVHAPLVLVGHLDGLVAVVDTRGGAQQHRASDALGELERILDHSVGVCDARRIEARELGVLREGARVLLGLRRDGTGVVGHQDHHAALHTYICKAHERVGRHVQAHLLHGDQRAGARVGGAGGNLHGSLLVDRPLHVGLATLALGHGLEHLGGRGARVAGHHVDARRERAERDGLVTHQEFCVHAGTSVHAVDATR